MQIYLLIFGSVMLVAGIYAFLVVQLNGRHFRKHVPATLIKDGPLISVVVPARNEEHNLPRLLDSLILQSYKNIEIIICDDQSTDRTGEIIEEYMRKDSRIRKISTDPDKPIIKNGKINALILLMNEAKGEYVLSTDADTEHHPDSVAYSYTVAVNNNLDLLSGIPKEDCKCYQSEVITAAMMFTRTFIPVFLINEKPIAGITFAIGQYVFMKRDSYFKTPGYQKVKGYICDDVGIARLFVRCGLRYSTVKINKYVTCYMYNTGKSAFIGIERSLGDVVPPSLPSFLPLLLIVLILLHIALAPIAAIVLLILLGFTPATLMLAIGTVLLYSGWYIACRREGWSKSISSSFSVTILTTCVMYIHSFYRNITGKGFIWKDRRVIGLPDKEKK